VLGLTGDCGGVGCARTGSAKSARLKTKELVFALILALPVNGAGRTRPNQHQFPTKAPAWDDRLIASAFGGHAVDLVARGKFDRMVEPLANLTDVLPQIVAGLPPRQ
jgi:hypothetical protein